MDSSGRIYTADEADALGAEERKRRGLVPIGPTDLATAEQSMARVGSAESEHDARRIFRALKKRERKKRKNAARLARAA